MNNMINLKRLLFSLLATGIILCGCSDENNDRTTGYEGSITEMTATVHTAVQQLWNTSPLTMNTERSSALGQIQGYADKCLDDYFLNYLKGFVESSESMEKSDPILVYYRMAFDRVLSGVQNTKVEQGTVAMWSLYNMGYIVKTHSGCFGVDISHRWAKELAPYLDFLCVTHNHSDHYSNELIQSMFDSGKPVLSNYLKDASYGYTSKVATDYTLGKFNIKTNITDHNNSGLSNFVTVFLIDCGDDAGNFTLMHTGDSNYKPSQYTNIVPHINLLILRYAPNALTENDIIGVGDGQVQTDFAILSHILELAHAGVDESRWSVQLGLERASKIDCEKTIMPMWGEKLVWKNDILN